MIHAILLEAVFRGEFGFYHTVAGLWDVSHRHHWLHRDHPSGTTECTVYDGSVIKQYPEHSYTQLGRLYPGLWCSSSEFFAFAWASGVIAVIVSRPNCGPEVSFFESSNLRLKHSSWRDTAMYITHRARPRPAVVFVIRYICWWVWKALNPRRFPG